MKSFSVFLLFVLSATANVPFFTNDASMKPVNYVSSFDCSEKILYVESVLPMENLVFVPWSDLEIDNYSKHCPNNPVYHYSAQGKGPFLLLNGSVSDFDGKVIVALVNHNVLTLQKRQEEIPLRQKKSLFQTYVFFNTATFLAFLTVGILLIILFFGIRILAGIQSPTRFEIKKI